MAGFLFPDALRAHSAPSAPSAPSVPHGPCGHARPRPSPRRRPVLLARWLLAPDGRLGCQWTVGTASPPVRLPG
jgi:hypothetical protein